MKMKGRKATVFWIINFQLLGIILLLIFYAPEILKVLGSFLTFAMLGNGAAYIGGNVWHAWQKSKYYHPALDQNIELKQDE